MSFYDDASLIVYPSGYKESKIYAQKPVPSYGAEIVTPIANSDFSSDTGYWTLETNISIGGGLLSYSSTPNNASSYKTGLIQIGKTYKIEITISGYSSGFVDSNNGNNFSFPASNGTHTVTFVGGNTALVFSANGTTTLSIDNVSVKEVLVAPADLTFTRASSATRVNAEGLIEEASVISTTEEVTNGNFATDSDWTKETGWSITGGNLIATSVSGTAAYQVGSGLVSGKKYQVQFEITEYTTGAVGLRAGTGATLQTFNSIGVHYADMVASGALQIRFDVSGTTTLKVDNVSVKELITSNIPRIDYSNGCGSLLLEPQRTNLNTYSDPTDAQKGSLSYASVTYQDSYSWGLGSVINNAIVFVDNSTTRYAYYNSSVASGTTYSLSFFIKMDDNSVPVPITDFLIVLAGTSFGAGYNVESYGNNVYRVSVSGAASASNTANGVLKVASNSTKGFRISGFQVEASSYPTSYIPTSGTTTTRIADTASKTGISSVIGQTEGTIFLDFTPKGKEALQIYYQVRTTGSSNVGQIDLRYQSGTLRSLGSDAGVTQFAISSADIVIGQRYKCAVRYKLNDVAFYVNGTLVGTDTSASFTSSTKSQVSFNENLSSLIPNAEISEAMLFTSALTDDELADLTGAVHQTFNSLATFYNYTIL